MLELRGLSKHLGGRPVLSDVSLTVDRSEFFALLGPSGCGKTTLLRIIAGLETPDSGEVWFEGRRLDGLGPHERPFNLVFQRYALFPHLSVQDNVAFGLRMARVPRKKRREQARAALSFVGLEGFDERGVDTLSGGQQQRVALARAIVLEPKVLLLDEPLSALDPGLRRKMQAELAALQERLKITFVLVTHDQHEALFLSRRVAVMSAGRIEQCDKVETLYFHPANDFVADFVGAMNVLPCVVESVASGGGLILRSRGGASFCAAPEGVTAGERFVSGDAVLLYVRPEHASLSADRPATLVNVIEATATDTIFHGETTSVVMASDTPTRGPLMVTLLGKSGSPRAGLGHVRFMAWDAHACVVLRDRRAAQE